MLGTHFWNIISKTFPYYWYTGRNIKEKRAAVFGVLVGFVINIILFLLLEGFFSGLGFFGVVLAIILSNIFIPMVILYALVRLFMALSGYGSFPMSDYVYGTVNEFILMNFLQVFIIYFISQTILYIIAGKRLRAETMKLTNTNNNMRTVINEELSSKKNEKLNKDDDTLISDTIDIVIFLVLGFAGGWLIITGGYWLFSLF